jgi:hypothetical protein
MNFDDLNDVLDMIKESKALMKVFMIKKVEGRST